MISTRVLKDLLQEPFGPYRDREILSETCQTHGTTKLVLYSFVLEHEGHVIGLDESEHSLGEHDDRICRFRGVMKIANLNWLSGFGVKIVETELNLRATQRAFREGERRPPSLKLIDLFGDRLAKSNDATWQKEDMRLTVRIQGEKNMPAVYMRATHVRNGLLWSSKAHNRNYQVATMDVETYSLSENFFWQWRLVALMEKIVDQYPFIPATKRTPIWFVERYLEKFACPSEDKHRRLIFDEEDSDVKETGKTATPRQLLKPHTSEILGLFAAQAEWLIANNEVKRKKLFDISAWEAFAKKVRSERKRAARRGVKWGLPVGKVLEESPDEFESDVDGANRNKLDKDDIDRLVRKNPVIGKSNKTVARKIELAQARAKREIKMTISSDSGSEGGPQGGAEYLSDFSEPSDVEENDSDYRLEEEEVLDRIPWQLQLPPNPPDVDGRWWCPLCDHEIDLHNLRDEEKREIPGDLVEYILKKQWRNAAYDKKVLQGFRYMMTKHYWKHFEERGVKIEKKEGRTRATLINRQRRHGGDKPIRGPMPARGTLGGESRVVPIVHAM